MRSLTSEEKLLKIIRKKDNPLYSNSKPKEASSKDDKSGEHKSKGDLLGFANIILIIGSIGTFCFLGYKYYIFQKKGMPLPSVRGGVALERKGFDIDVFENKEPISYYEEVVSRRDIFQAPWEKDKKSVVKKVEEAPVIGSKLRLVGVLLDDNPTAIIEDLKKNKTFFMSIGDIIDGAVLEEIQEGKAIFLQNSDRIEITQ